MEKKRKFALWQTALVIVTGLFCGVMMMIYLQTQFDPKKSSGRELFIFSLWVGFGILGAAMLLELRKKIHKIIINLTLNEKTRQHFLKYHSLTYLIFLGYGSVLMGVRPYFSLALFLFILFSAAQAALLWLGADKEQKERWYGSLDAVPALFFVSGFAALIYQVVWQRVLFATFGSNIESVTVIVSVFMFGLGVGALAGGQLQKYFPQRALQCFVAIEILIGIFGLFSIPLIHTIGTIAPHDSLPALIGVTYALLAFPTMLMGSTLPVLVGHLRRHYVTLGGVVGKLYAFNTLGSACASFLTVMLLFTMMGQQSTLIVAAVCNAATAFMAWSLFKKAAAATRLPEEIAPVRQTPAGRFSYPAILFFSAAVGYISLSLEILWLRVVGFMTANMPQVFGTLLAVFLTGIAYGAVKARRWSEAGRDSVEFICRSLLWMAAVSYLSVPLASLISAYVNKQVGEFSGYVAALFLAYFSGGIFPMLCQMIALSSSEGKKAALSVSWVYFFNIVGATLGSLVTGFVLLDLFTLQWNVIIISLLILAFLILVRPSRPLGYWLTGAFYIALAFMVRPALYDNIIGKLMAWPPSLIMPRFVNENRHGIIVTAKDAHGDRIYGNGAYDGRFNIDPLNDNNKISRIYMLAALHPHPERVLEMGMSAGSATKVLTMYRPLKELITVEINPGYVEIISHYPQIASALASPKLKLQIDDGRRWLVNHPDEKFDVITMNTIYYWRNNATNLLSQEFLTLCKKHLNPGGVVYYNTTDARDSVYTAAHVFAYVTTYINFVAASDSPLADLRAEEKESAEFYRRGWQAGAEQSDDGLSGAPGTLRRHTACRCA